MKTRRLARIPAIAWVLWGLCVAGPGCVPASQSDRDAASSVGGTDGLGGRGGSPIVNGTGGSSSTGGKSATGGAPAAGGTSSTGGASSSSSGGGPATGGGTATGGTSSTGGTFVRDAQASDGTLDASQDVPGRDAGSDVPAADGAIGDASVTLAPERVMRIQVDWTASGGYVLAPSQKESSGTVALGNRAKRQVSLGSFVGTVSDPKTGERIFQQTIGIGNDYLKEIPSVTFRYPEWSKPFLFTLVAENATTGAMEKVLEQTLDPSTFTTIPNKPVESVVLRAAKQGPALIVVIYAEGYVAGKKDAFIADAKRVVATLESKRFPGQERMEFRAVFAASAKALGTPSNLGTPVPERDSFLGLYYPYWTSSYDPTYDVIVYPTRERRFRDGVGQVPYDYPIVLLDSSRYLGIGNYNEYTGIPAGSADFEGLLVHESGHFFGLNEEYSTGGTELTFAKGIKEPFSQNVTYQTTLANVKWRSLISASTPVPTPTSQWNGSNVGVYEGGYAGVDSRSRIPVPDGQCTMSRLEAAFCPVCRAAILAKVLFDLGE